MNGARALLDTLVASGVEVCFTNPGTSEMHFVAALDQVPEMRGVLTLFEGVATGAADGYGRMAGRPAATLLHLGPGLGNGLANLHNARRARTPIVNIVGDHALSHQRYDAQLQSDIATVARNVSSWIVSSTATDAVAGDAAAAVAAAAGPPGSVATLVLPADVCWTDGASPAPPAAAPGAAAVAADHVEHVAALLRDGGPAAILLGGRAGHGPALDDVARVAAGTGAKLLAETFPARLERGAGRPPVERLSYLGDFAAAQLAGLRHLVLVDAASPVSFFAYPDKPSNLVPEGCEVTVLAAGADDVAGALAALAAAVGAPPAPPRQEPARPARPTGALTADTAAQAIGALLPEHAIVSDEANTSGLFAPVHTAGAPAHDWLTLTGGAIGQGLPVAVGAAIACPDRKVLALQADGSALYTIQALWTMAREDLDVTVVVFNNRSYAVLNMELDRVGGGEPGPVARSMFDLSDPPIDFVTLAAGLGVPASRADTAESFVSHLERALDAPGPRLVEAMVPPIV
ncbi:acetolactate synthase large subunit [Rhabdothermincola salaria]|uniref:acetolactate synthase large subunit n=1 Tax=Rhabdothermincola salaria TaxID=2903142 RepID=UPI001E5AB6DB|nr:acetolactate synthase large subunit [Rhabdothermincola salaria]